MALFAVVLTGLFLIANQLGFEAPAFAGAIGGSIGIWFGLTIDLSPKGIDLSWRQYRWDSLCIRRTRFGESLRNRPGTRRCRVFLPMYVKDWPNSPERADVSRWAPDLLVDDQATGD